MSKTPFQEQHVAITSHGDLVSVDQLVSPTLGFIAQMTGKLTKKRYKYATIFVDQASRLGYIYFQKISTVKETLEAETAFQQYARDKCIIVKAYHTENGVFRSNRWQEACKMEIQQLTFVGVNAHHTNGLAKKRIRDLQNLTRTQIMYAASKWKGCITGRLWSYAI